MKSGYIAEIDGQHRDKGSEYALMNNPNIIMTMPIVLTIGSRATAQRIINQDEERAPINKSVVAQYKYTMGNNVLKRLLAAASLTAFTSSVILSREFRSVRALFLNRILQLLLISIILQERSRNRVKLQNGLLNFLMSLQVSIMMRL